MEEDIITLTRTPPSEGMDDWVGTLCQCIGATIREKEQAADQFCWRLSLQSRHWLLFYSEICDAVWLQPLESCESPVKTRLMKNGYL